MAIFRETKPGMLYELSPGRDGRLLVWSPGLMKYKDCTSLAAMASINSNYLKQDIDDGCWFYQLPSLINGDNMFYNDDMTELYGGRVPLWHFESNLQSLQSGVNMFKGCALDAASVKRIADTLPNLDAGTITLGIHYALEGDSGLAASLAKIESKGWSVETEYNLPYGFTELDYLASSGTQYIDTCEFLDSEWSVTITAANTAPNNNSGETFRLFGYTYTTSNRFALTIYPELPTHSIVAWVGVGDDFGEFLDRTVNSSVFHTYSLNKSMLTFDGSPALTITATPFTNATYTSFLFKVNSTNQYGFVGRVASCILYQGNSKKRYFRPVLDADGVPCMYDTVSHTCFHNIGSGKFGYRIKRTGSEEIPFSLRDPYYVAPSGIYARLIAENELDIVADTDMKEAIAGQEGYIWFANTAEAYEHFDITQQPAEGEVIDA